MKIDFHKMSFPFFFKRRGFAFLLLLNVFSGNAQNIAETRWFFGNSVYNLVFDGNGRGVELDSVQSPNYTGISGSITITDQFTGNLLFYSDGSVVFDASHNPTSDGNILNGITTVNVPVLVAPVVGQRGQYYVFTNAGSEMSFAIVDANQPGNGNLQFPLGEVTNPSRTLSTSSADPSEGMMIIPRGDGREFYLITQNRNTFQLNVMQTGTGFGSNANYDLTSASRPGFEASHFAYNRDSAILAIAPKTANRNILLVPFDVSNGQPDVNNIRSLDSTGFDDGFNESVYDLEWSPDGLKLYFSRYGGDPGNNVGQLYQINFADSLVLSGDSLVISPVIAQPVYRSLGLKKAIDNRIYHLYQEQNNDPIRLARINRPDSLADSVLYQPAVFNVDFNGTQFPAFTDGYDFQFDTLGFTFIDSCTMNVTKFFPIVEPTPNRIFWDFGDGSGQLGAIVAFRQFGSGMYPVTMTAEVNGIRKSTPAVMVNITDNPLMIDLGNDTTICVDEMLTLDAGGGDQWVWNTGATTQTIDVDTAGIYWVEATHTATGCTLYDEIEVTEYGLVQSISNQWYFGERAGIEFTNGPIAISDSNRQQAIEGCATITDVNGKLLFYTDGFTIWNKDHLVMQNGDSIGGDPGSAQNAIIMPFAGDRTMFYVFTTETVSFSNYYALRYTIVDMKKDAGRGAVVSTADFVVKAIRLSDNSTQRLTSSGFTGSDNITIHDFGNNTFRSFRTGFSGLTGPVYSFTGSIHSSDDIQSSTGYMKIAPTLRLLAVNIPNINTVEIFDFENGVLSNPRTIDTQDANLYGLEFSAGASKLYLSTTSSNSKLIQYDLDSINAESAVNDITATKFEGYPLGTGYGALQRGPNGQIFMAIDRGLSVGTITSPDSDDLSAGFDPQGLSLSGRTSRLGLPNFVQNQSTPLQMPSMTAFDVCIGQVSTFSSVGRDNSIENYTWIFGDGQLSTDQNTTHTYTQVGTYTVQLRLSNRCDQDTTLFQQITINPLPMSPTANDVALCDGPEQIAAISDQEVEALFANGMDTTALIYNWSNGQIRRIITVNEPADLFVSTVNIRTGCTSDPLRVFVADARPKIDIGSNLSLCQGDSAVTLPRSAANQPLGSYKWYIDGVLQDTANSFQINTVNPGNFEYTVAVVDDFAGCIGRDTIQVEIRSSPQVNISLNSSTCLQRIPSGSIRFDFLNVGSYRYSIVGPQSFGPINTNGVDTTFTDLPAGSYTATVTNLTTGCDRVQEIDFEEFTVTGFIEPDCETEEQVFVIANTNYSDPGISYMWVDPDGNPIADMDSVINVSRSGKYSVTATNETGICTASTEIDVAVVPISSEDISLADREIFCTNDPLRSQVELDPGIFNTYEWRFLGNPAILSTNQVYVTDVPGIYEVTLSNGFTCKSFRINVVEDCTPVIFAPNAFSPNGDEVNNEFFVYPRNPISTFEILIYTRWGELVYRSENVGFRWNGVYKGSLLPPGTYVYLMKFSSPIAPNRELIEQYGSVTLIR